MKSGIGQECWLVLDRLWSQNSHTYRLHWLLLDCPYEWQESIGTLSLHSPVGPYRVQLAELEQEGRYSLVRADSEGPRGWRAPYYSSREPALSLALELQGRATLFWTLFGPKSADVTYDEGTLRIESAEWNTTLQVQTGGGRNRQLLRSASLSGSFKDQLDMSACTSS